MLSSDDPITLAASGLVTYLVHSTLILGAVWAGVKLTRAGARTRDLAWKCALCLPLATTTAHIVWPERALARRYTVEVPMLAQVAGTPADVRRAAPRVVHAAPIARAGESAVRGVPNTIVAPSRSASERADARSIVVHRDRHDAARLAAATLRPSFATLRGLALLGAALLTCCILLVPRLRLAWLLRRRTPVTDGLLPEELAGLLPRARAERGAPRSVRLSVSDELSSPIALGILWPEIVVPRRALSELSRPLARALVAHELAHHARRDPLWTWLAHTVATLFALQPLNRVARRELVATAELLADDLAVEWTNDGVGLAQCLAEVAGWLGPRDRAVPALAMVRTKDSHGLRRRVERALERPAEGNARYFGPLALVVGGAVALAAPGLALVARAPRASAPHAAARPVAEPRALTAPRALATLERQLADTRRELARLEGASNPDVRAAAAQLAARAERLGAVAEDLRAVLADQPNTLGVDDAGSELSFLGATR